MRRNPFRAVLALSLCVFTPALGGTAQGPERPPPAWDTFSDTWVATDGLGRSLPLADQTGPPRPNKWVGIFYFLWLGQHGDAGPFDITKILTADPEAMNKPRSPLWGPLHAPHHWGESLFGYYVSDDESVLAKHAQMLADADVDTVVFDVTNQLTYPRSWQALCRVWDRIRRRGGRTPQIAFLCPFGQPRKVVRELYDGLYGPGLFPELWFRWEGKPLILADPAALGETLRQETHDTAAELTPDHTLGQSFTSDKPFDSAGGCFPTWRTTGSAMTLSLHRDGPGGARVASQGFDNVSDNAWLLLRLTNALPPGTYYLEMSAPHGQVGWWSHSKDFFPRGQAFRDGAPVAGDRTLRVGVADERLARIQEFFTFRKPQPDYFVGPRGPGEWGWLEVYPQHAFYRTPGVAEEVTVGVAQNALDGRLSVLSNPRSHGRSFHEGRPPPPAGQDFLGRNFAEQWRRAFELDPSFVFITGWNEWIAGRFDTNSPFHGDGPVTFVDQFSREYSRDIEAMRGGHGDAFYYQMVAQIRRFKGTRPGPTLRSRPIQIDGRFEDWTGVEPEFRDDLGDPVRRDHPGWGKAGRYVNHTGRNDLIAAKVSGDKRQVFFHVRTREPLTSSTDPNWMLLFLDTDGNPNNGWLGYDFVVNRTRPAAGRASLERHQGPGYRWADVAAVECALGPTDLELAISWALLGLEGGPGTLDFKWADNLQQTGDWSDFTLNGDAAPNDRFNYRAKFP